MSDYQPTQLPPSPRRTETGGVGVDHGVGFLLPPSPPVWGGGALAVLLLGIAVALLRRRWRGRKRARVVASAPGGGTVAPNARRTVALPLGERSHTPSARDPLLSTARLHVRGVRREVGGRAAVHLRTLEEELAALEVHTLHVRGPLPEELAALVRDAKKLSANQPADSLVHDGRSLARRGERYRKGRHGG